MAVVGASKFLFLKNLDIILASFGDLAGIGRGILSILAGKRFVDFLRVLVQYCLNSRSEFIYYLFPESVSFVVSE